MNTPWIRPVVTSTISAAAFFFAALSASAGPWESLFNGKDLEGWTQLNGTAPYAVVDGAIVGTTTDGSPNSFLATDRTFGDFILEYEARQDVGPSNSGVQVRSESRPDYMNRRVHGYQLEIDPSGRAWTGAIYDEARRGWIFPGSMTPEAHDLYQFGRWNHFRIEAIGSTIRTWVNGRPVAHIVDDLTPNGFVALQVHSVGRPTDAGRLISWRNIRIQTTDLTPSPVDDTAIRNLIPNDLDPAEAAQGWRLLWDGETATGWRGANQESFPAQGWKMEDGELIVAGTSGGDIVTTEGFSAFELQLEFKLTEGANSGIKYFVTESEAGVLGLEYQLLDDERHPDAKLGAAGNRTLGSLYDLIPRLPMARNQGIRPRIGAWQHARIVVRPDDLVEHWLNGIKIVDYERGSPLFRTLVARSKYAEFADFGLAAAGPILLQDHGDEVHFRSIKIRPLE